MAPASTSDSACRSVARTSAPGQAFDAGRIGRVAWSRKAQVGVVGPKSHSTVPLVSAASENDVRSVDPPWTTVASPSVKD